MSTSNPTRIVLEADREHGGLRLLVLLALVGGTVLFFLVANVLLASLPAGGLGDYTLALSCLSGLLLGLATAAGAEYGLKRVWPSGRRLVLDEQELRAIVAGEETRHFRWSGWISAIKWYFSLRGFTRAGRERRVPASWLCLACQVQQEDERLVVYSLMPRDQAASYLAKDEFEKIDPAEQFGGGSGLRAPVPVRSPELPAELLSGPTGPHWLAERRRWAEGLELAPADFGVLLDWLRQHQDGPGDAKKNGKKE
ncbi:MAG: hypothetical protein R3300_11445 [Candidatus Promineifilaceae bacterium]|nr:hypothetical protein [Candidatus Promineifilaceae bacterium]